MQETEETWVQALGQEDPLEEGMASRSSILAWKIPWTEEAGGLQSMGLQRMGYSPWGCRESDMTEYMRAHTHTHTHIGLRRMKLLSYGDCNVCLGTVLALGVPACHIILF